VTSASVENEIKVDASSLSAQESQSQSSPSKNQLSLGQEGEHQLNLILTPSDVFVT